MKVRRLKEEPGIPEQESGSTGVTAVDIVLKRSDMEAYSSRMLRIEPGGHTAYHDHAREHIAVILHGKCRVETNNQTETVSEAHVISIPASVPHRFFNNGTERLAILIMNFFPPEVKQIESLKTEEIEVMAPPELESIAETNSDQISAAALSEPELIVTHAPDETDQNPIF
jgi:quercetin dioxygenase-like cupin family protein